MTEKITEYVVGFLFDHDRQNVALIRKNRPEWQAGCLNGIGGHLETNERPYEAMCREFHEETGLPLRGWISFLVMDFPGARIHFYKRTLHASLMEGLRTMTDEEVGIYPLSAVCGVPVHAVIPNLAWLLPLAAYKADNYDEIHVRAAMSDVLTGAEV